MPVAIAESFVNEMNIRKWGEWCNIFKDWTADKWKTILWLDESIFTFFLTNFAWREHYPRNMIWMNMEQISSLYSPTPITPCSIMYLQRITYAFWVTRFFKGFRDSFFELELFIKIIRSQFIQLMLSSLSLMNMQMLFHIVPGPSIAGL